MLKIALWQRVFLLLLLFLIGVYVLYNSRVAVCIFDSEDNLLTSFPKPNSDGDHHLCISKPKNGNGKFSQAITINWKKFELASEFKPAIPESQEGWFFLGCLLVLWGLVGYGSYRALRPLQQLKEEAGDLDNKGNRLNESHYPSDLMPLAEKLNKFYNNTHDAKMKTAEAEKKTAEAEKKTAEAEKKCSEVIDIRMEIATLARDLGGLLKHDITNIKNMMPTPVKDWPEELQRFVYGLSTKTGNVVEQTEKFIQSISSIIHKERANIHETLAKRIKCQSDTSPEIQLKAEGMDNIRDIQVSIGPYPLERICAELLCNAEKYCGPAMKIHVRAIRHDNYVFVEFHNDVRTFPEGNLDDLFKFGIRGHHKDIPGSGHGLYHVKQIADASACELKAERSKTLRGGVCFSLKVPIHHPEPAVG